MRALYKTTIKNIHLTCIIHEIILGSRLSRDTWIRGISHADVLAYFKWLLTKKTHKIIQAIE